MTKPAAVKIEPWGAQIEALREIGRVFPVIRRAARPRFAYTARDMGAAE